MFQIIECEYTAPPLPAYLANRGSGVTVVGRNAVVPRGDIIVDPQLRIAPKEVIVESSTMAPFNYLVKQLCVSDDVAATSIRLPLRDPVPFWNITLEI